VKLGCTLRPDNVSRFPLGWIVLSIVLIIIIVILLLWVFRLQVDLVDPNDVPNVRSRYAVVPGIEKAALNSCGNSNQDPCIFDANTLGRAIELCDINFQICREFSYDPISQQMKITGPNDDRQPSQQGNLYLQQIGNISIR
jgi:hypothetical protein